MKKNVVAGLALSAFAPLLVAMRLPCQSVGARIGYTRTIQTVRDERQKVTSQAQLKPTNEKVVIKNEVIEVLTDGSQHVRAVETVASLQDILAKDADARTPQETKALADHVIEQQEQRRLRIALEVSGPGAEASTDPVFIPATPHMFDVITAKGEMQSTADTLVGFFDQFTIKDPLKIVITPDTKRVNGFMVKTPPEVKPHSRCALGDALARNSSAIGEITKLFSNKENFTAVEITVTQDALGYSTVEMVPTERQESFEQEEESFMKLPRQSPGVIRSYSNAYAGAPAFVSTGACWCPCRGY